MTPLDYAFVLDLVLRRSGIALGTEKHYLVDTRLGPLVRQNGYGGPAELVAAVRAGNVRMETAVVEAMTTNETLFFRDRLPFEQFEKVLIPKLVERRRQAGKIRIWCAACSSGQEPFSLIMLLEEMRQVLGSVQVEIVATDISQKILDQAKAGSYSQFEVQRGLPVRMLLKHFRQSGTRWIIDPRIVEQVNFATCNLTDDVSRFGTFDIIFCRNVLIYFAQPTKAAVFERLRKQCAQDGYLLLGGAETVLGITTAFMQHGTERGIYVPAGSPEAAIPGIRRPMPAREERVA